LMSADINAYTLNSGKWCRIRSDGSNYRKAWVGAFRAYFKPKAPMAYSQDMRTTSTRG